MLCKMNQFYNKLDFEIALKIVFDLNNIHSLGIQMRRGLIIQKNCFTDIKTLGRYNSKTKTLRLE